MPVFYTYIHPPGRCTCHCQHHAVPRCWQVSDRVQPLLSNPSELRLQTGDMHSRPPRLCISPASRRGSASRTSSACTQLPDLTIHSLYHRWDQQAWGRHHASATRYSMYTVLTTEYCTSVRRNTASTAVSPGGIWDVGTRYIAVPSTRLECGGQLHL